jgi:hypothetical protein
MSSERANNDDIRQGPHFNEGEQTFETALHQHGLDFNMHVRVGKHVVDFEVRNPRNPDSEGKLVEVTRHSREEIDANETAESRRKHRQMDDMEDSGRPWTILTGENLDNIRKASKRHENRDSDCRR